MSRLRPSPAMVVACLALLVALGGTGYAAIVLPANSVGAKQLKKGSVERAKIKPGAIDATNVAANSLGGASINESSLAKVPAAAAADTAANATNAASATTAANATNATNATSAAHATSSTGIDKVTYKSSDGMTPIAPVSGAAVGTLDINCDAGQHPVGVGIRESDLLSQNIVDAQVNTNGYLVRVVNFDSTAAHAFTATVICIPAASTG